MLIKQVILGVQGDVTEEQSNDAPSLASHPTITISTDSKRYLSHRLGRVMTVVATRENHRSISMDLSWVRSPPNEFASTATVASISASIWPAF